jgi:hypothetical protein
MGGILVGDGAEIGRTGLLGLSGLSGLSGIEDVLPADSSLGGETVFLDSPPDDDMEEEEEEVESVTLILGLAGGGTRASFGFEGG